MFNSLKKRIYYFFLLLLTENVNKFTWFSHMWNHQQPHLYENQTQLEQDMVLNKNFAKVSFSGFFFLIIKIVALVRLERGGELINQQMK